MSMSLQEYCDYLSGLGGRQQTKQPVKAINKPLVKKIKPKTFTTKKR
jgi:hypothetical protein